MSVGLNIEVTGKGARMALLVSETIQDKAGLHERIAADALMFVKELGASKSEGEHRTADRLGGKRTGHLERAFRGIEAENDESSARLLVPGASRLRAAFGAYTLTPKNSKYLTLPISAEAYGRRAGEFEDLFPITSKKGNLLLVRKAEGGGIEPMYFLTTSVDIPEDSTLIPFEEIYEGAADSVEAFIDDALKGGLA